MKFTLIDRIVEFARGERIVAAKAVSLSEEYLADHFPTYPVLPGVLMLEAMVEAARWLVRESREFAPAVILLRSAKNVTYKSFVRPGHVLTVTVTCQRLTESDSEFSGLGECGGIEAVRGRFSLLHVSEPESESNVGRWGQGLQECATALRARFALLSGQTAPLATDS